MGELLLRRSVLEWSEEQTSLLREIAADALFYAQIE